MANNDIIEMISISEEINTLNLSSQNILRHLDSNPLDKKRLVSLLDNLNTRVSSLVTKVNGYNPKEVKEKVFNQKPSYVTENKERKMVDIKKTNTVPPTPESVGNTIEYKEEDPTMELPKIEEQPIVEKKQPKKIIGSLSKKITDNRKNNRRGTTNVKAGQRVKKDSK